MGKRSRLLHAERALARDTPDEIHQVFDLESSRFRQELHEWLRAYQKLMRLKHGSDVVIDMKHERDENSPSSRVVTAYVRKTAEATPIV